MLNEDEDFVAEEIRKLLKDGAVYKEEIARPMLGKTYFVVPTESELFDENWVGLLNDDGEKLYFPKTTVKKVECSKWTQLGITVKLGNKERFDKEQISIKEPFSVTNLPFTS